MKFSALAIPLMFVASIAYATDARERGFLRNGMTEGEVLMKVGPPDRETVDLGLGGTERRWLYLPHARDPQTLTTVTFRGGVVVSIVRTIAR